MQSQAWAEILMFVKNEQASLKSNSVEWQQISFLLENEFIAYSGSEKPILVAKLCSDYIKLVASNYLKVSDSGIIKIESIGFKASLELGESNALAFSRLCNYDEEAKSYQSTLNAIKTEKSASVEEYNPRFARTDWLIPLFKSDQELSFYQALKEVYPNLFVYPNVAISNIFSYEQVKGHLDSSQQEYFFKGIIDFVAYDPLDHTPKFFFEVDSFYHDSAEAKVRDNKKNKIFDIAGIKLHRIRLNTDTLTEKYDFMKEIKLVTA